MQNTEHSSCRRPKTSDEMEHVLREKLGIKYLLIVLGDKHAIDAVKRMAPATIDREMFKKFFTAFPDLAPMKE